MKKKVIVALAALTMLTACKMEQNPFLTESPLQYGAPQFDKIENSHYLPAFRQTIAMAKEEIDAIVNNPEEPTFQNTIEALEYSGRKLSDVASVFYNLMEAHNSDELQEIAEEISPMMTELSMYSSHNATLFSKVKKVYEQRSSLNLDYDQEKLLEKTYKSFTRSGAALNDEDKKTYEDIQQQLSLLSLEFSKNVLASTNAFSMVLTEADDIAGIPEFVLDAAKQSAQDKEVDGYRFDLSAPSYSGFLKYADRRDLREKIYKAYNSRAFGGETDNSEVIKKMATLRYKEAALLGYKDYADYQTEERMVKSGDNVRAFMAKLMDPALPVAKKELADLEAYARKNGFEGDQLMPWDFSYYAEKMRVEYYDLSVEELKPYFRLDDCINAVFSLANRLYGLKFVETDLPVYHKDVKVYDVFDKDGSHLALFYADFFPRESKRSGAWMTSFSEQYIQDGVEHRPFISLVTNFTKPTADKPSLLTHDEFTTLLHEFGHSLHGMLAQGRYPGLTGTSVDHDFVELPSQIMENWGYEPEFLNTFAKHYQTGEPIPAELVQKIVNAKNYMSAYYHMRQLNFGTIDMAWHTINAEPEMSALDFENAYTTVSNVLPVVPGCITSTSFSHIFSGGYAAGYYSYKWAEVLAADGFSLFQENGIFDVATAAKFRHLLEMGGSVDASQLYREFRGHDPEPEALLRQLDIIK